MKYFMALLLIFFFCSLCAEDFDDDFDDGFDDSIEDDSENDFEDENEEDVVITPPVEKKKKSQDSAVRGNTKVSTEGYISFLKERNNKIYSPSFITLNSASDYHFDSGFHLTGWFDSKVGFPDKDVNFGMGNFLYNSYGNGGVRVIASYSYKELVEVG
ncbi:hypothetical protein KAH37_05845, partial [bacterium]|nr:hypothetical protein [bacterium]